MTLLLRRTGLKRGPRRRGFSARVQLGAGDRLFVQGHQPIQGLVGAEAIDRRGREDLDEQAPGFDRGGRGAMLRGLDRTSRVSGSLEVRAHPGGSRFAGRRARATEVQVGYLSLPRDQGGTCISLVPLDEEALAELLGVAGEESVT